MENAVFECIYCLLLLLLCLIRVSSSKTKGKKEKLETTLLGNCTFVISKLCLVSILSHKSNMFSLWKPPVTGIPISLHIWDSRYRSFYIDVLEPQPTSCHFKNLIQEKTLLSAYIHKLL